MATPPGKAARACMTAAFAVWAGLLLATSAHAAAPDEPALSATQIAPGVFVHIGAVELESPSNRGDIANLGFIVGRRCVAVIDTGSTPAIGQRWRAAIERETALPVCYVINTHAHPDHILGNQAFEGPDAEFVGSAKFNAALSAREPFFINALQRDLDIEMQHDDIVYPTILVPAPGTLVLDLGSRKLTLQTWPTAHTDNDLTVFDDNTRTLFAGDLLFSGHLPVVDGKLNGWLAVMQSLARVDAARVVPGHGAASTEWPGVLAPQRNYLSALQRDTRAALKAHASLPRAVETIGVDNASAWQLADQFHRRNVTAAYAELEWE